MCSRDDSAPSFDELDPDGQAGQEADPGGESVACAGKLGAFPENAEPTILRDETDADGEFCAVTAAGYAWLAALPSDAREADSLFRPNQVGDGLDPDFGSRSECAASE